MLYIIFSQDTPDSLAKRNQVRSAHQARLKLLQQQGRLVVAGPTPAIDNEEPGNAGYSGSAIIAEFDCLETAKAWAMDDPYVAAGIYQQVTVKPFKRVF